MACLLASGSLRYQLCHRTAARGLGWGITLPPKLGESFTQAVQQFGVQKNHFISTNGATILKGVSSSAGLSWTLSRPSFSRNVLPFRSLLYGCRTQMHSFFTQCKSGRSGYLFSTHKGKISARTTQLWNFFRNASSGNGPNVAKSSGKNGKKPSLLKKNELRRLLQLAEPERGRLAVAIVLLLLSSAVTMAVPYSIGRIIDIIYTYSQEGDIVTRLRTFCGYLFIIFIIGGLANFGRVYLMQTSGNRIVQRLREMVFSSIMRQEVSFFDKTKTGELINRLSSDTSLVGNSLTMNISDGLRSTAQTIAGISLMVYMSPKLAAVALCIVPPVVLISRYYGRYIQNLTRNVQDSLADSTQIAEERISNMRTVRAFARELQEQQVYNQRIDEVLKLGYKEALARGMFWGMTGLSGNMMILSVFYYGGLLMTESQITVGELSSFMLYAAFVGISIGGLSTFYSELMKGLGATTRLWELTDRQPTIPLRDGHVPTNEILGTIEFRNITFAYPTRDDLTVFKDLTLSVPQGTVMAVVGSSGSGKSTLASLLLRYYDPLQGSVHIDGMNIRDLSPYWIRNHTGIVSQEPMLFSCSIEENIRYGAVDPATVTPEEIMEAAKKANAATFINHFPQGMGTLVGERGVMLSGGQKQRIAIARAILKNPKILLLDEATSALDSESEHLVQEALERVMVGRTVITIAHRLSTIKNAHQIAVLDAGRVAEIGTYENLMKIPNGLFAKLVDRQTISQ